MPSLVPGIHVLLSCRRKDVDGRDKPGHDDGKESAPNAQVLPPELVYFTSAAQSGQARFSTGTSQSL